MSTPKIEKEEYLERLWEMKEKEANTLNELAEILNGNYNISLVEELANEGMVEYKENEKQIKLTKVGERKARKIIRAHRIGERLIYDVFGGDFETAACEFEHTVAPELVDGICTLLGHPRECPHGMPIPKGNCCRNATKTVSKQVVTLKELEIGESAKVAYLNSRDDRQMHQLDGLQIRPRSILKLHQRYPSYVIECEGAYIAIDDEVASNICVWTNPKPLSGDEKGSRNFKKKRHRWGKMFARS